jgi:hypothetical protein
VVPVIAVARGTPPSSLAILRTAQTLAFPLQEATTHPGATMTRAYPPKSGPCSSRAWRAQRLIRLWSHVLWDPKHYRWWW